MVLHYVKSLRKRITNCKTSSAIGHVVREENVLQVTLRQTPHLIERLWLYFLKMWIRFSVKKMESSSLIMNHCMSFIPSRSASDTIREILIADRCPCLFVYLSIVVSSEICTTGVCRYCFPLISPSRRAPWIAFSFMCPPPSSLELCVVIA